MLSSNLSNGIFHRVEKKYILNCGQYDVITDELHKRMELDIYSQQGQAYGVQSLYYDTPGHALVSESLSNRQYKEKLRLRSYGQPQPEDLVYIEIKKKINGVGCKRRCRVRLDQAYRFLDGGLFPDSPEEGSMQLLREIYAMLCRYGMELGPSVHISASRLAFAGRGDAGLRITFDSDVLGRTDDLLLESGKYGGMLLGPGQYVMEVKTFGSMPLWLTGLLASARAFPQSFSKHRAVYYNKLIQMKKAVTTYA